METVGKRGVNAKGGEGEGHCWFAFALQIPTHVNLFLLVLILRVDVVLVARVCAVMWL